MSESYDQAAIVAAYADPSTTIASVAQLFGIKNPATVSVILKLNGVKLRQGNTNAAKNLTPEARARGIAMRRSKALVSQLRKLITTHGRETVLDAFDALDAEVVEPTTAA